MAITPDHTTIIALATNPVALSAYLEACANADPARGTEIVDDGSIVHETAKERAARMARPDAKRATVKRTAGTKRSSAKSAPAGTKQRTTKQAPTEWVVNPAWEGIPAGPRMMAAAIYHGLPVATCNKLAGNKLALSLAIAKQRGIPVKAS